MKTLKQSLIILLIFGMVFLSNQSQKCKIVLYQNFNYLIINNLAYLLMFYLIFLTNKFKFLIKIFNIFLIKMELLK